MPALPAPEREMSSTQVLSPTDFEEQLEKYLYERSEEWRAVRVGEKEVSEQAGYSYSAFLECFESRSRTSLLNERHDQ